MTNALVRLLTGEEDNSRKKPSEIELAATEYRDVLKYRAFVTEGDAHLTKHCMDRAIEVDSYRRELAGDDETLNHLLAPLQMAFIERTATRLNGGQSPTQSKWGF
ncbi:hypothetical protein [Pseudarthrobacter sp. ATCC 49987]|uniref:hypothetical protein n=1 Tax=Pseudarthrobacter sp. ATCC 49987 TaxID=2698204 RepID=UPI00136ABAF5|nr:hypothetical protein [Pseudarthrobacter sp. ATCC 49987]